MQRTSISSKIFHIFMCLSGAVMGTVLVFEKSNTTPEWLKVLVGVAAVFMLVFMVFIWRLPLFDKETAEGRQEMEDWLCSQGYRRFNGTVKVSYETVTFKLGDKTDRFLNHDNFQEHNGYKYWDNGDYRTVKLANSEMANVYFVK